MAIFKRLGFLSLMLCMFLSPVCAEADTRTWDIPNPYGALFQRVTVFSDELPDSLREILKGSRFENLPCYRGAQVDALLESGNSGEPPTLRDTQALIALDTGSGLTLLYMGLGDENPSFIEPLGAHLLLPGRDFIITASDGSQPVPLYQKDWIFGSTFFLQYALPNGGMEGYGFTMSSYGLAAVTAYATTDAAGNGIAIQHNYHSATYPNIGFYVSDLPATNADSATWTSYLAPTHFWAEYMTSIADFPTTEADAKRISVEMAARIAPFANTDYAVISPNVNLRENAPSSSKKLGITAGSIPARLLGQKAGSSAPWYHLQIGQESCWVSHPYAWSSKDPEFSFFLWNRPLPMARAVSPVTLRAEASNSASIVLELPEGMLMHVMAYAADGWLHVNIPRGEIGFEMDLEGTTGFLPASAVTEKPSLNQLRAN